MKNKTKIIVAILLSSSLVGCQTLQGQKQNFGAVAGGLLGALVGSKVGGGNGKKLAVLLGTLGGAWLGSTIGASLDKQDQLAMSQRSAQALDNTRDGQSVKWNSRNSGASATITPGKTHTKTRKVQVARHKSVARANNLQLIGKAYVAGKSVNVRHMPSTSGQIVNSLRSGEVITAVGKVQGSNWMMVARDNLTIGYVYAPLLRKANQSQMVAQKKIVREPIDLSKVSLGDDIVVDTVSTKTQCRSLDYKITAADGSQNNEKFQACKAADGAWEISS